MMKITHGGEKHFVPDDSSFARAILEVVNAYQGTLPRKEGPFRNDIKRLWRVLNDQHRRFLLAIAKDPGISQAEIQEKLQLDMAGLRGVHNGLARICKSNGFEKPVRTSGYNASNKTYSMDDDVRATIFEMAKRWK